MQAFLRQWSGQLNFGRVREVTRVTGCFEANLNPDTEIEGWTTAEVHPKYHNVEGNDTKCFGCHTVLNARRKFFEKFDIDDGIYDEDITMADVETDPFDSGDGPEQVEETAQPFYSDSNNRLSTIRDYAEEIVEHPRFARCMTQRFLNYINGYAPSFRLSNQL